MPVYSYTCPVCGASTHAFRPIDQRDRGPLCNPQPEPPGHPVRMTRVLDAPMGVVKGPAVQRGSA